MNNLEALGFQSILIADLDKRIKGFEFSEGGSDDTRIKWGHKCARHALEQFKADLPRLIVKAQELGKGR